MLPPLVDSPVPSISPEQQSDSLGEPQRNALASLDRSPREALRLARSAWELSCAGDDARAQAGTALTLAIALNRIGEFQEVLELCRSAVLEFEKHADTEQVAHALCEAAWANTFIGDLHQALVDVDHARSGSLSPHMQARCDWIQARVLSAQSKFQEATTLLENSVKSFQAEQLTLEASRCEQELAYTRIFSQHGDALTTLERLRNWFQGAGYALDAAQCELAQSTGLLETGHHSRALESILAARSTFVDLKSDFFVAVCDRNLGIAHHFMTRYAESLQCSHRARDYFSAHEIRAEVSACDINLGFTYYWLNRYDEALQMYQEAEYLVYGQGREARTARIWMNMGIIYSKTGRYSRALDLQHRALRFATSKGLTTLIAGCHGNLASCYRELGDYDQALSHELQRREILLQHQLHMGLIVCNISLAEIHLAKGNAPDAAACLEYARTMAASRGLDRFIAACDRLLARTQPQRKNRRRLLARLGNARRLFLKQPQPIDAALCDMTQAELHLQWNEIDKAQRYFRHAAKMLSSTLPDQAWRADYGLGRCAIAMNKRARALEYHLRAVRLIAASRSALVTEQLSNDFFERRRTVYDDTLELALSQQDWASGLEVIEQSKARTFFTLLRDRSWKSVRADGDSYVAALIEREKELRYQLNHMREQVAGKSRNGQVFRGGKELAGISAAARKQLQTITRAHESVAT